MREEKRRKEKEREEKERGRNESFCDKAKCSAKTVRASSKYDQQVMRPIRTARVVERLKKNLNF